MNKETAKKVSEILQEIENLSKYKDLINDRRNGKVAHIELVQHYGIEPLTVIIEERHTGRFIELIESIIGELNNELSKL